mmetsp:Transcript_30772/g.98986  ORF Transcript_30772/g.98986 Transcript_30772/m.98986 type:complete len:456 (-) Transcript_30772:112-1479(-)
MSTDAEEGKIEERAEREEQSDARKDGGEGERKEEGEAQAGDPENGDLQDGTAAGAEDEGASAKESLSLDREEEKEEDGPDGERQVDQQPDEDEDRTEDVSPSAQEDEAASDEAQQVEDEASAGIASASTSESRPPLPGAPPPNQGQISGDSLGEGDWQDVSGYTESAPQKDPTSPRIAGEGAMQQLELLIDRMEGSSFHTQDAAHFLRRRAEIEETYARSLRRLYEESAESKVLSFRSLKNKLTRAGQMQLDSAESAAQAWSAIESHIMQTSEVHMALSERIMKISVSLKKANDESEQRRKEVERFTQRAAKELRETQKKYEHCVETMKTMEVSAGVQSVSPIQKKGSAILSLFKKSSSSSAEAVENAVKESERKYSAAKLSFASSFPSTIDQLRKCEQDRIEAVKHNLDEFLNVGLGAMQAVQNLFSPAMVKVNAIDTERDLNKIFGETKTSDS